MKSLYHIILLQISLSVTGLFSQKKLPPEVFPIQESILLVKNKDIYLSGDSIFFAIHIFQLPVSDASPISSTVYVDLIDDASQLIQATAIKIQNGHGKGFLVLPAQTQTGQYLLRSYTRWMRNNLPNTYAQHLITVINPNTGAYSEKKSVIWEGCQIVYLPHNKPVIAGIHQRIPFYIINGARQGISAKVSLFTKGGSQISLIQTDRDGYGEFSFHPHPDSSYVISVYQSTKDSLNFNVPISREPGIMAEITKKTRDAIYVKILCSDISKISNEIILSLYRGQFPLYTFNIPSQNLSQEIRIPTKNFPEGIYSLGIFHNQKLMYESLFLHSNMGKPTIELEKMHLPTRTNSQIQISFNELEDNPQYIHASIYYCGNEKPAVFSNLNTLLPYGLKDTLLDSKLSLLSPFLPLYAESPIDGKKNRIFLPEIRGIQIQGKVLSPKDGTAASNVSILLSIHASERELHRTQTDSTGTFIFRIPHLYGTKEVFLQVESAAENWVIVSEPQLSSDFVPYQEKLVFCSDAMMNRLNEEFMIHQLREHFPFKNFIRPNFRPSLFYGMPDEVIRMKDYIELPELDEVFKELVKSAMVIREDGQRKVRVLDKYLNRIIGPHPAILINGIPVNNSELFLRTKPSSIDSILVVAGKYYYGDLVFDGIIDIYTKKPYLRSLPNFNQGLALTAYGWQDSSSVISHTKGYLHEPDLRLSLLWETYENTNIYPLSFSFKTSDVKGYYKIQITAVSKKGTVYEGHRYLVVE